MTGLIYLIIIQTEREATGTGNKYSTRRPHQMRQMRNFFFLYGGRRLAKQEMKLHAELYVCVSNNLSDQLRAYAGILNSNIYLLSNLRSIGTTVEEEWGMADLPEAQNELWNKRSEFCKSCSASIIAVDSHIFVTEVAGPISSLFVAHPKLHQDFQIFVLQDFLRPVLIYLFRLSISQQR